MVGIQTVTTDDEGMEGAIPPVCEATQDSEKFESNTRFLPSVYRIEFVTN